MITSNSTQSSWIHDLCITGDGMADGGSSVIRAASSHTQSHKTTTHFRTSAVT